MHFLSTKTVDQPELEKRVRLFLTAARTDFMQLSVRADGERVYLSGLVGSFYLRQLAICAARRVAGVHNVVDEIEVPMLSRR